MALQQSGAVSDSRYPLSTKPKFTLVQNFPFSIATSSSASLNLLLNVQKDLSNYWVPNLWYAAENGTFTSVPQVGGVLVYYLQRPGDGEKLTAFPEGLRMVAGDPMKRSFGNDKESRAINYACLNFNGPATPETNGFPTNKCSSGLRAQVFFPSCWDGKNLDSPDHKSHLSYPVNDHAYGSCPPSHPVHFVSLFYEVLFSTDLFDDMWYGDKQPFVWSMGDPTGYGLHGDFFSGWDVAHLQKAIDECTNNSGRVEDCPVFTLTPNDVAKGCRIPPSIDEQTSGTLDALPGCNPVQAGPGRAVAPTDCKASGVIGKPQAYFTDLTQTKKWSYVGCGTDSIYARKFTGASTSSKTMTVETCVDFCSGKGFSVAGTEYGNECYCANSIPSDAAPVPGYMGNCMMPCAGDAGEYCGGGGTISLYQKCTGGCQNVQFSVVGNSTTPAANSAPSVMSDIAATSSATSTAASPESTVDATAQSTTAAPSASLSSMSVGTNGYYGSSSASSAPAMSEAPAASETPASSADDAKATSAPEGVIAIPTDATSAGVSPTISGSAVTEATSFPVPSSVPKTNVTLPDGWKAGGCYVDPIRPRLFKFWASFSGKEMSSSKCVAYCDEQGFPFAGTQNGGQCFCSEDISKDAELKDDDECSTPCKGVKGEMCGGPGRLSVFTKLDDESDVGGKKKRHLHKHRRSHYAVVS
ncbi:hypothetical protein GJ744_010365 [Endocarpon pusillum]|uniref:WSC domain-containing protein n=1 Tax=Endocarpon pusillum TaxID=364733 RepID=A0A8H7AHK8_9EURO|nr:hypothetical protein GJ744_010365 [Endocarpon pusillum]